MDKPQAEALYDSGKAPTGRSETPLGGIVGRFDALVGQEGEKTMPIAEQFTNLARIINPTLAPTGGEELASREARLARRIK
ncbi:MAG: hypothetical protein ACP5SH_26900 [Syntrophobacteraceae bacterium]